MFRLALGVPLVLTSCVALLSAAQNPATPASGPAGRGVIAGQVVDTNGAGVPGAQIMIGGPHGWFSRPGTVDIVRRVLADEHGHFAFDALPGGDYAFSASKPGYLDGMYKQRRPYGPAETVPLGEGERRLDVTITIARLGVVTGTVTDHTGEPVIGIAVTAMRPTVSGGHRQLEAARAGATDGRGEYRITGLEPGPYALAIQDSRMIVLADADGAGTRTLITAPLLYPASARDADVRDLLQVGPAAELTGVDLRVSLMAAAQISGTVTGGEGDWTTVRLRAQDGVVFGFSALLRTTSLRPDGTFLLEGIPPGQYVLDAIRRTMASGNQPAAPATRPSWSTSLPLTVGAQDVTDVALALRSGPRVSGRFVFDGAAPPPDLATARGSLYVKPESADGRYYGIDTSAAISGAEFTVTGLVPGRYVLRPPEQIGAWHLRTVTVDGRDVSVMPIEIASDVSDVIVTFTDRRTSLGGVVRSASGGIERDALVVAFSVEPRLWSDYGVAPRRLVGAQVDDRGGFGFDLPPGDYFVAATAGELSRNWRERGTLTRLATAAERVTLREGDALTISPRMVAIR